MFYSGRIDVVVVTFHLKCNMSVISLALKVEIVLFLLVNVNCGRPTVLDMVGIVNELIEFII